MSAARPLKIGIVAGEESGDLLGADAIAALKAATGRDITLVGVGGRHLQALGLTPLFDAGDIALMGFSAVLRDLPRLAKRIGDTARAIVAAKPDCLITIDNPDFTLRVARKVRAANPDIPIIHYICPRVWAWRPGRAAAMKPYVDHILCILPFEPAELERLGGPPGTFVGHRLTGDAGMRAATAAQAPPRALPAGREKTLLLLPGSRRSEVSRLIEPFGETVSILRARGHRLRLVLPTVPHVAKPWNRRSRTGSRNPRSSATPPANGRRSVKRMRRLPRRERFRWSLRLPGCRSFPATSSTRSPG